MRGAALVRIIIYKKSVIVLLRAELSPGAIWRQMLGKLSDRR